MPNTREKVARFMRSSRLTRWFIILFFLLIITVVFIGLDNVTGLLLGVGAATILVAALTHRWRKARYFIILCFSSFAGAVFLAGLQEEVVYRLAYLIGGDEALNTQSIHLYSEITSFVIFFFAPAGIVIGFLGGTILGIIRLADLRNPKNKTGGYSEPASTGENVAAAENPQ